MRTSVLATLLGALLSLNPVTTEPIPLVARTDISKRVVAEPFGKDGNGIQYWAWSRIPYDSDWNSQFKSRELEHDKRLNNNGLAVDRDWVRLAGEVIWVQGIDGGPVEVEDEGRSYNMHMHAVVGKHASKKDIVVAFEGTDDTDKALADLRTSLSTVDNVPGEVHKGFKQCFQSVMEGVKSALKEHRSKPDFGNYNIVFTGHSLGGATALIAAQYFAKEWNDMKDKTYAFTYGAPRAGNLKFQKELKKTMGQRMFNFRHQSDIVSISPFISWGYANPAGRYVFKPDSTKDSWLDKDKWQPMPDADDEPEGLVDSILVSADTAWQKLQTHTGYFQDDKVVLKRDSFEEVSVSKHRKRQAPTSTELWEADDALIALDSNNWLSDPPRSPPDVVYDLTGALNMKGQELKLWSSVLDKADEVERRAYLNIVRTIAEEHA